MIKSETIGETMKIEKLNPSTKAIILMGISFNDKESLIKEMNEWADEVKFFDGNAHFTDFEVIENPGHERQDIVCTYDGVGIINPFKRIEYRGMGWVWIEDYLGNKYYED